MPDRKKFGKTYIFRSKRDSLQEINKTDVRGETLCFPELESLRVEGLEVADQILSNVRMFAFIPLLNIRHLVFQMEFELFEANFFHLFIVA